MQVVFSDELSEGLVLKRGEILIIGTMTKDPVLNEQKEPA